MNSTPSTSSLSECQAQQMPLPQSLQTLGLKLSSSAVQQRLYKLRQDHAQVRMVLETFH